jgi:5-methylthioribose kinase
VLHKIDHATFEALRVETLPTRLARTPELTRHIGDDASKWHVAEVGDGNLNLVFIVSGPLGSVIVKQALPYVRMVGDSWPLSTRRSFFEYQALARQALRAPGVVPEVYLFDEPQAMIVMEFLSDHVVLRQALIDGRQPTDLGAGLGLFLARTLFRGSALHLPAEVRKRDLALFAENIELSEITENLVFTEPYFDAPMNRHTSPQLDDIAAEVRGDRDLKIEAQKLKQKFSTHSETLLHGDLHTGSIMVSDDDVRVIDAEFAIYGPMAFDVGVLLANFWMAYLSQRGHEANGERRGMRRYLADQTTQTWSAFVAEFGLLWRTERFGPLFDRNLFELAGDGSGVEQALSHSLRSIWRDALGFAGLECHRRILGLAHNAEFETIADPGRRAACERRVLLFGRHLVMNRVRISSVQEINAFAEKLDWGERA